MPETKEIRDLILKELPRIIENDPEVQELILRLSRQRFADKETTDERFDRILNELRETREQQDKQWAENTKAGSARNPKVPGSQFTVHGSQLRKKEGF